MKEIQKNLKKKRKFYPKSNLDYSISSSTSSLHLLLTEMR